MPMAEAGHRSHSAGPLKRALAACTLCALSTLALGQSCLYSVADGDTFHRIAAAQGCETRAVIDANAGVDASSLMPDQLILLPDECECPPAPVCTVTVAPGDTAYNLAIERGCYLSDIEATNPDVELGKKLQVGTELQVPTDKCRCGVEVVGRCSYVVAPGDTLFAISRDLHCPKDSFIEDFTTWNPGLQPDLILVKQRLVVPPACDCPDQSAAPTDQNMEETTANPGLNTDAPRAQPEERPSAAEPTLFVRPASVESCDVRRAMRADPVTSWIAITVAAAIGAVLGAAITALYKGRTTGARRLDTYPSMGSGLWTESFAKPSRV